MAIGVGMNSMGTQTTPDLLGSMSIPDLGKSGGFDIADLLGKLAPLLSALGIFGSAPSTSLDYNPSLTPATASALTQSAGLRAYSGINRQTSLAKSSVGSQYYARGLGRSGAAVGDIAGLGMARAGAIASVEPQLAMMLAQLLQVIDQRSLQQAEFEKQGQQSQWGDLADYGASLASALPYIL